MSLRELTIRALVTQVESRDLIVAGREGIERSTADENEGEI